MAGLPPSLLRALKRSAPKPAEVLVSWTMATPTWEIDPQTPCVVAKGYDPTVVVS